MRGNNKAMALPRWIIGAAAGVVATIPMTLAMVWMHRRLPDAEQYALPPKQIIDSTLEKADSQDDVTAEQKNYLTMLGHFGFGGLIGAIYATITPQGARMPVARAVGFGLLVWLSSYQGWIPVAGLLPPASGQPRNRNALMAIAHIIWGAVTGRLLR